MSVTSRLCIPELVQRQHDVGGLFVQEVSPAKQGTSGALILVPGGFHGYWAFEAWMGVLACGGWSCYAMSLRGHTGSRPLTEKEWTSIRVADYVADLHSVQDWIGSPVAMLGHSMGGLITQLGALDRDTLALVLVSSVGPGQLGSIRDPFPTDRPLVFERDFARRLWFHKVDDSTFNRFYARLSSESPSVLNDYSDGSIYVDADRVDCPVLAIGGEHDATPVHAAHRIAEFYRGDYVVVPDVGHNLMYEPGGRGVAQLIVRWLSRKAGRSPLERLLDDPEDMGPELR